MNKILVFLWAVVVGCASAPAQTNSSSSSCQLFSIPSVQLRAQVPEPKQLDQSPIGGAGSGAKPHVQIPDAETGTPTNSPESFPGEQPREPASALDPSTASLSTTLREQLTLNRQSDFDPDLYRHLEQGGFLTRQGSTSGNVLERCLDAVFQPEIIRIGKTSVSCSIITAIKRKNPLCLINPIFFNLSW